MVASAAEMPRLAAHCDGATGLERLTGAKAAELVPFLKSGPAGGL
jgi:D-arginine dehydrogenase